MDARGVARVFVSLVLPAAYLVLYWSDDCVQSYHRRKTRPRAVAVHDMIIWLSLMPTPLPRQLGNERHC